jgi:hypothetical protein
MRDQAGYDDWLTTPPDDVECCNYPDCKCPVDMGPENVCARGLPMPDEVDD